MKTQSVNLIESLGYDDLKNLTREVKETLGTSLKKGSGMHFTAAELWNIQRNRKNVNGRKFYE